MPNENHTKAAKYHELAAQAHREAADHHRQGNAAKAHDSSTSALMHSKKAHELCGMTQIKAKEMSGTQTKAKETVGRR